jgi:hypothetical protein
VIGSSCVGDPRRPSPHIALLTGFGWTVPDEELFRFHLARVSELGCHLCGRKLYETMLVWETDLSLRDTDLDAAFADVWCALPKVVFSRTLGLVDELRIFRNPIVVGGGTPFLPPVTEDVPLELIETRTFGSRVVYERYRRIRGDMD